MTDPLITGTITAVIVRHQFAPALRAASVMVFNGIELSPMSSDR